MVGKIGGGSGGEEVKHSTRVAIGYLAIGKWNLGRKIENFNIGEES